MITNGGKEIIAKFLLGQAPSYATHIALGCGAKPNSTGSFADKETMDFEMIRVPISSRGFVNEGGVTKLALSAEMPTEYRYEISEVALWSAASNTAVTNSDSRVLFTFDSNEGWQLHKTEVPGSTGPIPSFNASLDGGDDTNNINLPVVAGDAIFSTTADNETLLSSIRKDRQEGSRFLNHTIFMRGDTSSINSSFVITDGSTGNSSHIHLDGRNINLAKNSPDDEIKIALSIIPQQESNVEIPDSTRIVIEFLQSEINPTVGYARLTHDVLNTDQDADNRYVVVTKKIKDLETSPEFSWTDVRMIRIYTSVYKNIIDAEPSDEYYVVLDGIRFDNLNSPNPLYVMSGYSVVETPLARPIVKIANTSNYIEFRLSLGVS
jgi:hypothetical protein